MFELLHKQGGARPPDAARGSVGSSFLLLGAADADAFVPSRHSCSSAELDLPVHHCVVVILV